MSIPKLPEKIKRPLVPGIIILAVLLFAGGLYFHRRGLNLVPEVRVPEEEGEVSGLQTGLPENFPADIPLFEPAEILSSMESKEKIQVTLQTEVSAERVLKFYQQKMGEFGWRLTGMGEGVGILTFLKNNRLVQLTTTSNPDGSTLIILNTHL